MRASAFGFAMSSLRLISRTSYWRCRRPCRHLTAAWEAAYRAGRDIWSAVATQAMADLDVAEHGRHPAVGLLKSLARQALRRVWAERDGRFTALQTRNQLRALTATADRMGEAALRDPLTGLGNRHLLARAIEKETGEFSVIFVDVDHFKQVNDTYTHAVGDEVLRRVADLLRADCRSEDVLVRYGGDEFLALVFGAGAPAAARGVAERLLDAVRGAPWAHLAPDLAVTVSVGVGSPIPGRDAVAGADVALYAAKRAGRDRIVSL